MFRKLKFQDYFNLKKSRVNSETDFTDEFHKKKIIVKTRENI